jgi:hypothetical protein
MTQHPCSLQNKSSAASGLSRNIFSYTCKAPAMPFDPHNKRITSRLTDMQCDCTRGLDRDQQAAANLFDKHTGNPPHNCLPTAGLLDSDGCCCCLQGLAHRLVLLPVLPLTCLAAVVGCPAAATDAAASSHQLRL